MKKAFLIGILGAAMTVFGCSDDGGGAGSGGSAGAGGTAGAGGSGGDGGGGAGGDGAGGAGGGIGGETTLWQANTNPPGGGAGATDGCTVFVSALNSDIQIQVDLTLGVDADEMNNVTTAWQLDATQFLLGTLGNAAELGTLAIAAAVTDGTPDSALSSELTMDATGELIGAFIDGNTLSLATPDAVTAGSAQVTPDMGVSSYNVNWDGVFSLALTLGGNPLVEITDEDCAFDVQGDGVDVPVGM